MLNDIQRDNFYKLEIKAAVENREEILNYLSKELPKENKKAVTSLAKRLRYFKPALTFAAIYVTSSKTSIEEFLAKYSIHDRIYKGCIDEIAYPLIYNMCSKVLIDFIEERDTDALEIMYVSSYIGQNNIPDKLLISWFESKFGIEESIAERRYYSALKSLEDCKLIQRGNNNFSISFFILQDQMRAVCAIIEKRQEEFLKELSNVFCNAINAELNKDRKDLTYLEMLLPHIDILSKYLNAVDKKSLSSLYTVVGNYYFKAYQDYKSVLKYYIKAESVQRRIDKTSDPEQVEYADLIDGIGVILHYLDRKVEALEYYKKAMDIRERVLGKKHLDYATSLNNVGVILSDSGKYEEAMPYYKEALKIAKNNPGESVLYLHNIGCVYAEQNKYKEALKHFRKAQAIERNTPGEEKNLHILYNLSSLYYIQGNYKEALKNIREAILIEEERIIKQYPEYITSLNNISYVITHDKYEDALKYYKDIQEKESIYATYPNHYYNLYHMSNILYQLGNTKEALLYISRALSILVRIFGKKHQKYIGCLKVEGDIFCALGEYKKALECYVERTKILKEMHGEKNSDYASALNDIGDILAIRDKYKEALSYHKKALKIDEEIFGKNHKSNAESIRNIGYVLLAQGRAEQALSYFNQGLGIVGKAYGKSALWYISFLHGIGEALEYRGDYEEALEHYNLSLELSKEYFSKERYWISSGLSLKGRTLYKLGWYTEALKCQQQALKIRKKSQKDISPGMTNNFENLGIAYIGLNKIKTGIKYIKQALLLKKKYYGINSTAIAKTFKELGNAFMKLNNVSQAKKYYNKALGIYNKVLGEKSKEVMDLKEIMVVIKA